MKLTTAVAALSLFFALGCSKKVGGGASRVPVTIARAEQRPVPYELSGTGTVEPRQTASVQAQVTGILTRVAFHEGDDVAAGQLLFQRSEEHTSELQSLAYLVCRLLLEKKNKDIPP